MFKSLQMRGLQELRRRHKVAAAAGQRGRYAQTAAAATAAPVVNAEWPPVQLSAACQRTRQHVVCWRGLSALFTPSRQLGNLR